MNVPSEVQLLVHYQFTAQYTSADSANRYILKNIILLFYYVYYEVFTLLLFFLEFILDIQNNPFVHFLIWLLLVDHTYFIHYCKRCCVG